jgi:hypothetical protein
MQPFQSRKDKTKDAIVEDVDEVMQANHLNSIVLYSDSILLSSYMSCPESFLCGQQLYFSYVFGNKKGKGIV